MHLLLGTFFQLKQSVAIDLKNDMTECNTECNVVYRLNNCNHLVDISLKSKQ